MNIKELLARLSFRTGVITLSLCIPCYIISFAQMGLPLSTGMKSVLWVAFFGLAKIFQYAGLTILGIEGTAKLKQFFKRK